MPDGRSSRTGDIHNRPPAADVDSSPTGLGEAILLPLRPADTRAARRARPAPTLTPLWAEVASVLARAQPVCSEARSTSPEYEAADSESRAA